MKQLISKNENVHEYVIRLAIFFGSIVLVVTVENPIRRACGDVVFVAAAVFILAGSVVIATKSVLFCRSVVNLIGGLNKRKG